MTNWHDEYFNSRVGFVQKIDTLNKKIQIHNELDSQITIEFFHIINVTII
ncbi:YolD-like family protein [Heyndrickxia sporothermodurans]